MVKVKKKIKTTTHVVRTNDDAEDAAAEVATKSSKQHNTQKHVMANAVEVGVPVQPEVLISKEARKAAAKDTINAAAADVPAQTENQSPSAAQGKKRKRITPLVRPLPSPTALSLPLPRRPLPPHQLVLAPMVGGSELAFRLLARRHGAQLAYTPMMYSDLFVADAEYRAAELLTLPADQPLVAHFCGNNAKTLLEAARLAEPHCVAIDINLGCPQRAAYSGHFGSFCRGDGDPSDTMDVPLVLSIVSTLSRGLRIPLFCKIRLFDELDDTLAFCRQLEAAGCALLAVHGRYRGSPTHKREGPAHLEQVAEIKRAVSIPVLTNGNVSSAADLLASLEETGADGVMSAEGALDDPAIFARAVALAQQRRLQLKCTVREAKQLRADVAEGRALDATEQQKLDGLKAAGKQLRGLPIFDIHSESVPAESLPSGPCDLAEQYLALARTHRPTLKCVVFHLRRLCRKGLMQFELREPLEELSSGVPESVREQPISATSLKLASALIRKLRDFTEGRATLPTPAAATSDSTAAASSAAAAAAMAAATAVTAAAARARAVKAAAAGAGPEDETLSAAAAACAQKRRAFEQMQRRKAIRKGLPEDHFLNVGRAPPTVADVAGVRAMGGNERMVYWREHYGQHCIMHHMDGRCEVALTWGCGFLHEVAV